MTLTLHHPFEPDRSVPTRRKRLIALTRVCRIGHGWGTGLSEYRHRDRRRSRRRIGKEGYGYMAMPMCRIRMGRRQRAFFRFRWVEASGCVCVGLTLVMPCALSEPRSIALLTLSLPCYAHSSIARPSRATGGSREWGCRRRNDLTIAWSRPRWLLFDDRGRLISARD
ncbi:hypothetical protein FFLO_00477 [Filobasidium floriforme]|uniref:Uncharacterized protein n=1 Tax=Filobasidium floriforme TaxID=5210 RepID=A0A8K0NVQ1_9TREE|nr:uncharacterized protein HD553DRAFT_136321 [Filobasidium floriforme]KAG7575313.1 hypothetical protein FFLO_00477 [Filobasidium floriforme]KAH8078894.1 hypothetical protein HD553DRAFT_136321 [Filobasidium floriforme]